jgi:8-oxo-dGTP diphosphatase
MPPVQELVDFANEKSIFIPQLSVDCVIFGFHDNQLKILLLKMKGIDLWALPGGYVEQDEDTDAAALHVLKDRTGLSDIYLEQFRVFGQANRSTGQYIRHIFEENGIPLPANHWALGRFVSIGYYALVDFSKAIPKPGNFTELCEWFDIKQLPKLAFDHPHIIEKALETLQVMLDYKLVGFNLLAETFTMNELQSMYETILGTNLRRNNFQRKILSMGILERLEKKFTGAANKAPYLYRFKANHHPASLADL